jgi:hypothetical protein
MPSSNWRAHTRRSARAFFTRGGPSRDAVQLGEPSGDLGEALDAFLEMRSPRSTFERPAWGPTGRR